MKHEGIQFYIAIECNEIWWYTDDMDDSAFGASGRQSMGNRIFYVIIEGSLLFSMNENPCQLRIKWHIFVQKNYNFNNNKK